MRFQLDMSDAEIRALGVPRWKRGILRAMARYGMFVGDTGGIALGPRVRVRLHLHELRLPGPDRHLRQAASASRREEDGRYHFDVAEGIDWRAACGSWTRA